MFTINLWAIIIGLVVSFILGFVWYGPLFGKKWAHIVGMDFDDHEAMARARKDMTIYYVFQGILTLLTLLLLGFFIPSFAPVWAGILTAVIIWAGFIMPTVGAQALWSNKPNKLAWQWFLIGSGYQLVLFILFGIIFGLF